MTAPTLAVARSRADLRAGLADLRAGGRTVALVPTMGALHDGHLALLRRGRALADRVVVTVFVNPLQFAAGEDLDDYPRTLDADLAACAEAGADLVWAPSTAVVYPQPALVRVAAGPLGDVLEGASRPGHFDGVLTVVAKLLHLVAPDVAVFGEKDAQQLALVRRLVGDLDLPVRVEGVGTVRDADGLALSSRNRYLGPAERTAALALSRSLQAGAAATGSGPAAVLSAVDRALGAERGLAVDYRALVDAATLAGVDSSWPGGPALLLLAARAGATRLIDNTRLTFPPRQ